MGFNFGAFVGGAAEGGMKTYTTLKDQERKDADLAMRQAEFDRLQEQHGRERGLQDFSRSAMEKVGTMQYGPDKYVSAAPAPTDGYTPEQALEASGGMPTQASVRAIDNQEIQRGPQKMYSRANAMGDIATRTYGVDVAKGVAASEQARDLQKRDDMAEGYAALGDKAKLAAFLQKHSDTYNNDPAYADGKYAHVAETPAGVGVTMFDSKTGDSKIHHLTTLQDHETAVNQTLSQLYPELRQAYTGGVQQGIDNIQKDRHMSSEEKTAAANEKRAQVADNRQGAVDAHLIRADNNAEERNRVMERVAGIRAGAKGGSGDLAERKFDAAQFKDDIKENAGLFTLNDDSGKPQVHTLAKTLYTNLYREHGPVAAEQGLSMARQQAAIAATDPKTGLVDPTKEMAFFNNAINEAQAARMAALNGGKKPGMNVDKPAVKPVDKNAPYVRTEAPARVLTEPARQPGEPAKFYDDMPGAITKEWQQWSDSQPRRPQSANVGAIAAGLRPVSGYGKR